ncbi:MAG: hypothetical protein JXJ20_10760 [Anaerolineae bacterium]|nr:hypothetical protein [Anaerolineae bacterium]
MTLRPHVLTIAVLLAVTGLVFILVGSGGVSTGVFLPDPTHTLTPTPSPDVEAPQGSADHWTEMAPGQFVYAPDPDVPVSESSAQIGYQIVALEAFWEQVGIEAPAEDAPYPLLDVLEQMRAAFESQIDELGLVMGPDDLQGPMIELFGTVPIALLRVQIQPQVSPSGQPFSGLDLVLGLVERGEGEINAIQYSYQAEPDPVIYADFRAWLTENAADLAGLTEEESEAEAEATEETEPEATEEVEAEATEAVESEVEPDAQATAEPMPEATQAVEPEAEPEAEATEAVESEAEPDVQATEEPAPEAAPTAEAEPEGE